MAVQAFTTCKFLLGSLDLSSRVKAMRLTINEATAEYTMCGASVVTRLAGGVEDWSAEVDLLQDYADGTGAGDTDEILYSIRGSATTLHFSPTSAYGVTSPHYSGSALLTSYSPITGTFGEVVGTTATFVGAAALTRADS